MFLWCPSSRGSLKPFETLGLLPDPVASKALLSVALSRRDNTGNCSAAQYVHKDQPPVPSAITALRPPLLSPLLKLFFTSSSVRMSTRTQLNLMGPKSACNLVIVKDLVPSFVPSHCTQERLRKISPFSHSLKDTRSCRGETHEGSWCCVCWYGVHGRHG